MLSRRMILVGALGVMLGALPSQRLTAQSPEPRWSPRPAVEGFYTQLRFASDGPSLNANGIGARLMWTPAAAATTSGLPRANVGLYATFTPEQRFAQDLRFSSIGVGAVTDVRPFTASLGGRVDPFLSLGTGLLRTNVARGITPAPSPLLDRSRSVLSVVPGAGARVRLTPSLALQGDVRSVVTFRDEVRNNIALGAGLRFTF